MRALLLLVLLLPSSLFAGWTRLRTFSQPVSCGFFLGADLGFVGTCTNQNLGVPAIWRTTDGGKTWTKMTTPGPNNSRMTSIFMKDSMIGYATLWGDNDHWLWKTTNGGLNWFNHSQNREMSGTCVHMTPSALIVSAWPQQGGLRGGFSLNDGVTMQNVFFNNFSDESNGIAFADDLRGVVTPGPRTGNPDQKSQCYFTQDGGRSWLEGGMISESWGVYATKGTTNFFALPEGNQFDPQFRVVRSTDVGQSWATLHSFPAGYRFTGHIAGAAKSIYVQTSATMDSGLFRSDDLGLTWKNVGGPSNDRDTRFVVLGCKGEIVYAFDVDGGVWKTTDGGDGTLRPSGPPNLAVDSLRFSTICTDIRAWAPILFATCDDSVTIDALTIENDPTGQFKVDTIGAAFKLSASRTLRIPVLYSHGAAGNRRARLRIRAHSGDMTVDTTIDLIGITQKLTPLAFGTDTLRFNTICADVEGRIPVSFGTCDDSVTIDAMYIERDPTSQFAVDTLTSNFKVFHNSKLSVPIVYSAGKPGVHRGRLRIVAHSGDMNIDTTIELIGTTAKLTPFAFGIDTLVLTTICTNVEGWIPVSFKSCDDSVTIDAMFIENDPTAQFMLDTLSSGYKVNANGTIYVPIVYIPGTPGVRGARLHIVAHAGDMSIDTTIELLGRTVKLPEPYVPDIERGKAGDTVEIPIYFDKTSDAFSISEYEVLMSFNTDLIEALDAVTFGTLSRNVRNITVTPLPGGVRCKVSLLSPITEAGDLQQPLLIILARVYLTTEQSTTVLVDSFDVVSGTFQTSLLGCSERSSSFTINFMCGDSTLSYFMRTGVVTLASIHPNPNTSGPFTVEIGADRQDIDVTIEIVNTVGVTVRRFPPHTVSKGKSSVQIPIDGMNSGLYYLRLTTPYGVVTSQPITIVR